MANDAFTKPEVPDAFRDLMKISIEQTKRAFETFAATSEKAWKTFETSSQTAGSGLRSLNEKIAEITRNNAEANFALAMKLAESKDVGQAMGLQTEHARKQMESFVHQLEEIRDLAAQVIQDSTPSGMPRRQALIRAAWSPASNHDLVVLVVGETHADYPLGIVHDKDGARLRNVVVARVGRAGWGDRISRGFGRRRQSSPGNGHGGNRRGGKLSKTHDFPPL